MDTLWQALFENGVVIDVTHIGDDDAVAVKAVADILVDGEGTYYEAVGTSKRDKHDPADHAIGVKLAAGRAIRDLGRQIHRDAQELVRRQSDKAAEQKKAQEKALKAKKKRAKELRKRLAQDD
jgi:hypothetical protein